MVRARSLLATLPALNAQLWILLATAINLTL